MPEETEQLNASRSGAGVFATTHWTVVLAAADKKSPHAFEALETLCRTYWYPLYAFVRRKGHGAAEARGELSRHRHNGWRLPFLAGGRQ